MTSDAPRRILVIRRKAIGDVIVSMDVCRALREQWPDAHIALVVDRFAAPVVRESPLVDDVLVYDRRAMATGTAWRRLVALRAWIGRLRAVQADLAVDLMGTPQTAQWAFLSGARRRVGPRKRFRTWAYTDVVEARTEPLFAGDRFLDWVRALGIDPGPWRPQPVPVSDAEAERVEAALSVRGQEGRPFVVLNSSATWPAKAWPLQRFAEVARALAPRADVALAWGPGEDAAVEEIVRLSAGAVWPLPPTDLVALAAWLRRADVLVTTDSGPKHLAVAQGTRTVTVFGSTDPRGWQPAGPDHRALTHPVDCHPCNLLECPVEGHPCLDDLAARRVVEAVDALLALPETRA